MSLRRYQDYTEVKLVITAKKDAELTSNPEINQRVIERGTGEFEVRPGELQVVFVRAMNNPDAINQYSEYQATIQVVGGQERLAQLKRSSLIRDGGTSIHAVVVYNLTEERWEVFKLDADSKVTLRLKLQ